MSALYRPRDLVTFAHPYSYRLCAAGDCRAGFAAVRLVVTVSPAGPRTDPGRAGGFSRCESWQGLRSLLGTAAGGCAGGPPSRAVSQYGEERRQQRGSSARQRRHWTVRALRGGQPTDRHAGRGHHAANAGAQYPARPPAWSRTPSPRARPRHELSQMLIAIPGRCPVQK
jgi:hypothetical protein